MGKSSSRNKYVPVDVIWRAVGGDKEALGIIYQHYYGYTVTVVKALARKDGRKGRLTPDEEDILQDAWEETLRAIPRFRGN